MSVEHKDWDVSYERKAVILLALAFGLVGLDRWIIAPLMPSIMQDLKLNSQDAGNIIGALGLTWGVVAMIMGGLSDKLGRRKVLLPAIFGFSLLSGITGMATGVLSLIMVRAIMGITEGSFCPTRFAATNDASHPSRRGFNLGWQQSGFVGQFCVPWISDLIGRRKVAVFSFFNAAQLIYVFKGMDASKPVLLFVTLFAMSFFALGLVALLTGPIVTEAAPVGLVSSAIGVVVGAGEIFGGGVTPVIAGVVARHYGIQNILWLPLGGVCLGMLVCLFLKETAPRKLRLKSAHAVSNACS